MPLLFFFLSSKPFYLSVFIDFGQNLVSIFINYFKYIHVKMITCIKIDRYDLLQGCATECLQKLGQSVLAAYFHPLTLLFNGYTFMILGILLLLLLIK